VQDGGLEHLSDVERDCVTRYVSILVSRLGEDLGQVWLFGSAARGDMWPEGMPMRSDIDLLVLTRQSASGGVAEELVTETYPLFLECGRQIAPQVRMVAEFETASTDRTVEFFAQVREHGREIYRKP
jgi:hypothetical protein